jgi:hypothetical protein
VKVTARVTGDPVIGTGTTDAEGHVNVMVTIPAFTGDYMNIFVYAPPCNAAGAHFFYRAATATPPTSTPTRTPATPPATPSTTAVTTPPPTPPAPPSAGSGGVGFLTGNTGFDLALVALALVVFSSGFTLLGSSRKRATARVSETATRDPYSDEPPTPFN